MPAAMSLAARARGSNAGVATSIVISSAVFAISISSTNATARISASISIRVTPSATPSGSTASATRKWMRMFRWVRTT